MSEYTLKNLREIEDATGGAYPGVTAHMARKHLESRDLGVSLFTYGPDFRADLGHRHGEQEEAYVVVSGSGRAMLDGEKIALSQWDVLRVAPHVVRAFEAGPDGLELISIGGPRPEGGDGERVDVSWD